MSENDEVTRLRAALDYLRRKIDGYDSTFEAAEEIAAGIIDLRGCFWPEDPRR